MKENINEGVLVMTKYHMPIIIQKSCHIIMPEPNTI